MKGFSIIIVTWNALEHLKRFLPSVSETDYPNFEIIIADNASDDGSKKWIRSNFPHVKIVSLDQNYGYCGGNNRAAPFASKEILLFLNNDVEVDKNWLYDINKAFDHESVAAVQPKMRAYQQKNRFEYAGAAGGYIDNYGFPFCRGRVFDTIEEDLGQYDSKVDLFWASGAALAIRSELFTDCGGFDVDFEFHMEEIDLCWRLQNQGYKIRYAPESIVYHLGGGSLPMDSPRKVYYNFRNSLFMLWKNYSTLSLFTRFPIRLILDTIAAWKALFEGKPKEWLAVAKAQFHFIKGLLKVHRKRKKLQKKRIANHDPSTMINLSIVWQYFIKGIDRFDDLNS
ncbi:glycosyltransferase family 2 protein [Gracilimonas sp. Q87]|uniref:glycosyltransferase family 2 protein n=1 Tax=Gracilimonas sp. Q87 TaxID=3384766 RepID=UPI0039840AE1